MAWYSRDRLDIAIAGTFYFILLFGHTTHLYDAKKHHLVHSVLAHIYSLALHCAFLPLLIYTSVADYNDDRSEAVLKVVNLWVIIMQWTLRRGVSTLFNEFIQIWQQDIAHLRGGRQIRRQTALLFTLQALVIPLLIAIQGFQGYFSTSRSLAYNLATMASWTMLDGCVYAILFIFYNGLLFSLHLFGILNANLARVLATISILSSTPQSERSLVRLERELEKLAGIYSHLRRCVNRFKDAYQGDILLIFLMLFLSTVFIAFEALIGLYTERFADVLQVPDYLSYSLKTVAILLEFMLLFNLSGELLDAGQEVGDLMMDIPAHTLGCIRLERRMEMVTLQSKIERLHLTIYGMFDFTWGNYFLLLEALLLYIIVMIQAEYFLF